MNDKTGNFLLVLLLLLILKLWFPPGQELRQKAKALLGVDTEHVQTLGEALSMEEKRWAVGQMP